MFCETPDAKLPTPLIMHSFSRKVPIIIDLTLSKSEGLNKQKGCAGFFEIQYSSQECNFVWLLKKKKI